MGELEPFPPAPQWWHPCDEMQHSQSVINDLPLCYHDIVKTIRSNYQILCNYQFFSNENHWNCYKKLASRSWPVLFTITIFSYTCTLLFCWKIKKAVLITVFPSTLEYKPLFNDIYKKVAMITFSTVFTVQIYIFWDYSSVRLVWIWLPNARHCL